MAASATGVVQNAVIDDRVLTQKRHPSEHVATKQGRPLTGTKHDGECGLLLRPVGCRRQAPCRNLHRPSSAHRDWIEEALMRLKVTALLFVALAGIAGCTDVPGGVGTVGTGAYGYGYGAGYDGVPGPIYGYGGSLYSGVPIAVDGDVGGSGWYRHGGDQDWRELYMAKRPFEPAASRAVPTGPERSPPSPACVAESNVDQA